MYTIDSCKAFDMLFHFNVIYLLILGDSMENNTREREFSTIPVVEPRWHERKETEIGIVPIRRD